MKTIKLFVSFLILAVGGLAVTSCGKSAAPMADNKPMEATKKIDYKPYHSQRTCRL